MQRRIMALLVSAVMILGCFGGISVSAADQEMNFDKAYSMMNNMVGYLIGQTPSDRDCLYNWVHGYMATDLGVESMITLVDDQSAAGDNAVVKNFIYSFGVSDAEKSDLRFGLSLAKCIPTDARAKAFDDMKARKQFALATTAEQNDAIDAAYNHFLTSEQQAMLNHDEHKIEKLVIMQFLADLNKTFVITDGIDNKADFALYKLNDEFKTKLENGYLKTKYETVNGVDWANAEQLIKMFIDSANTSSKFDDAMKNNFKIVLGIDGVDMYVARAFDVSAAGEVTQVEGATSDIVFTAKSNITTDDLTAVKWYVDGVLKATGESFTYNPADLGAGASANVKAVFGAYEKETAVNVVSAPSYTLDITAAGDLEQFAGNTKEVTFTAATTPADAADISKTQWYVNGVLQSDLGETFKFTPSAAGEYEIKAVLNGAVSSVKKIVVKDFVLTVKALGELSQDAANVSSVKFSATATNAKSTDDVKWYVNGVLQSTTGAEFTLTPEADKGAVYVVYAQLDDHKSEEITVLVVKKAITITPDDEDKLNQKSGRTKEIEVSVDPSRTDLTPEQIATVKWYVNGIEKSGTGEDFTFRPSGVGEYTIVAKLPDGTVVSNEITVKVTASVSGRDDSSSSTPPISVIDKNKPADIVPPTETGRVNKFTDLEGHWAEAYMEYLYEKGILSGTSETTMSPDWGITRQEVAVLLVKMLGYDNETPSGVMKYTDDDQIASWAKNAVYVLSDRGVYAGYGDGSFMPEKIISRQELVSLLGRHLSGNYSEELTYADKDDIYYWAVDDVKKLSSYKIVSGYPDNTFRPVNDITRAEAAVILYNTMYRLGMIN